MNVSLRALRHNKVVALDEGEPFTDAFRIYCTDAQDGRYLSAWHDIGLWVPRHANMVWHVNKMPKGTSAVFEVDITELYEPMRWAIHSGNCLLKTTSTSIACNLGILPRTWQNPFVEDKDAKLLGTALPLEIIDIGEPIWDRAQVVPVRMERTSVSCGVR